MDVHDPYKPPPLYQQKFTCNYNGPVNGKLGGYRQLMFEKKAIYFSKEDLDQLIALYDAEIAYFDNQFDRLISGLNKLVTFKSVYIWFFRGKSLVMPNR
jgi:hypothetical protein